MQYGISDLVLNVQGASHYLKSCMTEYTLPLQQERERICNCGIILRHGDVIIPPKGEQTEDFGDWHGVRTKEGQAFYWTLPGMPDVVSGKMELYPDRVEIDLFTLGEEDLGPRERVYSGHAFSYLALRNQRMVLHGSCIAKGGKALLFSAPSGTGKSTHTGLWKKYYPETEYINDDAPVLRFDKEGKVLACGSPWSGKTMLNQNISVPLCGIVFLERGSVNRIEPLSKIEAMGRLLGESRKFPLREDIQYAADYCGMILERVPVYRLTCDISYEAVETVRKEFML